MKSFKAAFNSVYKKGLEKYGFKKVKGSRYYYARCVGDEIVHVITFRQFPKLIGNCTFTVMFGVATVYMEDIAMAFDALEKDSSSWLSELSTICYKENYYPKYDEKAYEEMIPFRFEYDEVDEKIMTDEIKKVIKDTTGWEGWDENSMMDEINKSFELTVKYAIPVLDKITTLEDCVNHFYKYKQSLLSLLHEDSDAYIQGRWTEPHNVGLLTTVVYGNDRFEEYENAELKILEECNAHELYAMNREEGRWLITMEQHENNKKERMANHKAELEIYKKLMKPEWQEKIHKELESRKKNNLELLRNYGLEI
ncbi:MAG: hypothetical protein NC092_11520 [Butyrivibrio sp.]|nr:hypothetical protein [Butyrivibrio sp.]